MLEVFKKRKNYCKNTCKTCGIQVTERSKLGFCVKHAPRSKKTEEVKKKLSESKIGSKNPMYGKPAYNRGITNPNISGDKSPFWKGGITPLRIKIRNSFEYRQWRSDVFTRDNFTCQMCGVYGVELNADHIKSFSLIIFDNKVTSIDGARKCSEFWNINNGRTLCVPCHKLTPNYGRQKK